MGTLATYGMLLLILTTDLRPKLKQPVWLAIHMLAYPIYAAALFHGLFSGTDSSLPLVQWMYGITALITLLLAAGRTLIHKPKAQLLPGPGGVQATYSGMPLEKSRREITCESASARQRIGIGANGHLFVNGSVSELIGRTVPTSGAVREITALTPPIRTAGTAARRCEDRE